MTAIASYAGRLFENHTAIFLLHGVIEKQESDVRNFNRKHILKDELADLLAALKSRGSALTMDEYVELRKAGKNPPPYSFIITFDDGFENNFSIAAPILEDFGVPAIFYITSGFVDDNLMSWADQIDYAVEQTQNSSISLSFLARSYDIGSAGRKVALLQDIRHKIREKNGFFAGIDSIIDEVFEKCGLDRVTSHGGSLDQKMSWSQVRDLSRNKLFSIGAHTHTHPILSFLPHEKMEEEVRTSLDKLETCTGYRTRHFCYPDGTETCYNDEVISCLKRHDIVCSPTAIDGVNDNTADLFHLRRIFVS